VRYRVLVVKAGNGKVVHTAEVAATTHAYVASLRKGRYRFQVTALNALGAGLPSVLSRVVRAR